MPRNRRRNRHNKANHLFAFFAQYAEFDYDPGASVSSEFNRRAMGRQFASFYGTSVDDFDAWHALCVALGVDPVPQTVEECREMVKSTHVNLVDFIDTRVTGEPIEIFETEEELREYTRDSHRFFPKESAKESGVLKYLLREIL